MFCSNICRSHSILSLTGNVASAIGRAIGRAAPLNAFETLRLSAIFISHIDSQKEKWNQCQTDFGPMLSQTLKLIWE
jgi:hypothetical protein